MDLAYELVVVPHARERLDQRLGLLGMESVTDEDRTGERHLIADLQVHCLYFIIGKCYCCALCKL